MIKNRGGANGDVGALYGFGNCCIVLSPYQRDTIYSQSSVSMFITHPMIASNSIVFDHVNGAGSRTSVLLCYRAVVRVLTG